MTISPVMLPFPQTVRSVQGRDEPMDAEKARAVARDLEALLVTHLIAAMRRTVPESGLLQSSASRRTLDGAFDHELARALVADGRFGFAKVIEAQLQIRERAVESPWPVQPDDPAVPTPSASVADVVGNGTSESVVSAEPGSVVTRDAPVATPSAVSVRADDGVHPDAHRVGVTPTPRPPLDDPRVTSAFGMRVDPLTGADRFHAGVDLGAPRGTPIHVAADGEVVFSGRRGAAGNVVEVRHPDGLLTSYAHADRTLVGVGQSVVAGEVIATVGSTGRSTGPHLHFSVRRNGQVVDPKGFIPVLGGKERLG